MEQRVSKGDVVKDKAGRLILVTTVERGFIHGVKLDDWQWTMRPDEIACRLGQWPDVLVETSVEAIL